MQKDEERIPQTEPMPLSVAQEFPDWVWELPASHPDARGKVPPDPHYDLEEPREHGTPEPR